MSDEASPLFQSFLEAGIAAEHPVREAHPVLVAPTTADHFNVVKAAIEPVACFKLEDARFEFDSSFILPEVTDEMRELSRLRKKHPDAPLSIFGHADPAGKDDYNKKLSGQRAMAMYGLLTRDIDMWEKLYKDNNWGLKATQLMLTKVGHDTGGVDGTMTDETREAVKAFQRSQGLEVDGKPGSDTRKKLFTVYMDAICLDDNGRPFQLQKTEFLAQGADLGGKGDYQGCGEFNPLLLLSAAEEKEDTRNQENAPNRRVMILLFKPGSKVDVARWPCPRAKEGVAGCKKRFWRDAERRRQRLPDERRKFEGSKDTFACRFYQRLTSKSPCERVLAQFIIRLFDPSGKPIPHSPFLIVVSSRQIWGASNSNADVVIQDLQIPTMCKVFWSRPLNQGTAPKEPDDFDFQLEVHVDIEDVDGEREPTDEASMKRLHNLGYHRHTQLEENVMEFQIDVGKPANEITGQLSDIKKELKSLHDNLTPPERGQRLGTR